MIQRDGDTLRVAGDLTVNTVAALFKTNLSAQDTTAVIVDLAQVKNVDSAAVSLMLAWVRAAQHSKIKLSFLHVPQNLLSLARLYGVADSLPLAQDISVQSALLKAYIPNGHA